MVTTYKNPTRVARKASEVSTAWEQIAPDAEFAGMTLTAFKTAIGESFTLRERAAQLEAELSANLARRAIADAETNDSIETILLDVKSVPPAVTNLTVLTHSVYALVTWLIPGNGGYPIKNFVLSYRLDRSQQTYKVKL